MDLINTLSLDLKLINDYNIKEDIFYSKFCVQVFKKMKESLEKGYSNFKFNNFESSRFVDAKYLQKENLEGVVSDIKKDNLKDKIVKMSRDLNSKINHDGFNPSDVILDMKDKITNLENISSKEEDIITTSDFDEIYEDILKDNYTTMCDARTEAFSVFDEKTGGWVEDTTSMLAGSSGRGKSAFSINLALETSLSKHFQENNLYVLYFNYEMSPKRFFMRCITKLSKVSKEDLKNKSQETKDKLKLGYELFKKANLLITHDTPKTINDTKFMIRKYCSEYKIRLIFIDYIGRIVKDSTERQKQEHQLLRDWVIDLSNLRRDISKKYRNNGKAIPFSLFVLSQLNREAETEGEANARKHMQGSYSMISELDYLYAIDYIKDYGFVLKNNKARDEEDGFWINYKFEKEFQNFIELGLVEKTEPKSKKEKLKERLEEELQEEF